MEWNKNPKVLLSVDNIKEKVKELGTRISKDYQGADIVAICLLRGGFIFTADLVRELEIPVNVDFMTTSSYEHDEISSGMVEIISDIRTDIRDKHVLIIDDIMDSGNTMVKVIDLIAQKGPKTIKTCVMLDKPGRREADISPDYVGFTIPDVFIVGYGLNYGDLYRNIPYIFTFDD